MGEERVSCETACAKAEKLGFGNTDQPEQAEIVQYGVLGN